MRIPPYTLALFALCILGPIEVLAQAAQGQIISVTDARPVAQVLQRLASERGWVIAYEDAPYASDRDIEDVSRIVSKNPRSPVWIPRRHSLTVEVPLDATPQAAIAAVLCAYESNPERTASFRQSKVGHRYVVTPVAIRDSDGSWRPVTSVLDTPIDLVDAERRVPELLSEMFGSVQLASGVDVFIGTGAPDNGRVKMSANGEPAREVLARLLDTIGWSGKAWFLNYGPKQSSSGSYALNFRSFPFRAQPKP